jgi:hypothetical protein
MGRLILVGILCIISATIAIVSPNSLAGWIGIALPAADLNFIIPATRLIGAILGALGIVFGAGILLGRKWSWMANVVLNFVWIALLCVTIVSDYSTVSWPLFLSFFPINGMLMLATSVVALVLLVRPRTRAGFGNRAVT